MILLLLLACKEPETLVIEAETGSLTVEVVNPTNCSYCDAFAAVETLRVDVTVGGEVVATDSFDWPAEAPTIPVVETFGVVRVELVGLAGGRVVSGGRTAEVALDPAGETTVPLLFVPVNTALPLVADTVADRSRHLALRRRDGEVMLVGGVDPDRDRTTASVERFDPRTYTFVEADVSLPTSLAGLRAGRTGDDEWLLVGGFKMSGGLEIAQTATARWIQDDDRLEEAGPLTSPRNGHCFAMYRDRIGVAFGGVSSDVGAADLAKLDEASGTYQWSSVPMEDFDPDDVTACIGLADERVYVQGVTDGSTGTWDFREGVVDPGNAFTRASAGEVPLRRWPWLWRSAAGPVWIAGGWDEATDGPTDTSRWFDPDAARFADGVPLQAARIDPAADAWIAGEWQVVAGGWTDLERDDPVDSLELVEPVTGEAGPLIPFDRSRNGGTVTTLADGSLLLVGGYEPIDAGAIDAALVVPWFDGAD